MENNMVFIMEKIRLFFRKLRKIRVQKMHLDYIAGLLSIPVLLTAILINFTNLKKDTPSPVIPTPSPQVIIIPGEKERIVPVVEKQVPVTDSPTCKKSIGPVTISYPKEGEKVDDNPVCIIISYPDESYCSVVWSYRINSGTWSAYNSDSPCLYNLPAGNVTFALRVKSTVSSDTKQLEQTFTYSGTNSVVTPPVVTTQSASDSATQK